MHFADLKNDFVFRKIFGQNPDLTAALLNDLLDRQDDTRIESLEVLPPELAPELMGAKLSILDLRCRDQAGRIFVVEMQLLHLAGFLNRIVFNACKTYVGQLPRGGKYSELADVIAVSICDYFLWSDADRDREGEPRVPLVSRWSVREETSGARSLGQVQYVFVELPKVQDNPAVTSTVERWAWLFRHATSLTDVPTQNITEAQRRTLELANEATFTVGESEAYRRVFDEIEQAKQLTSEGEARGELRGEARGEARGLREAIVSVCELLDVEVTPARKQWLEGLEVDALVRHLSEIKRDRGWPGD